jgi:hypothetical protein
LAQSAISLQLIRLTARVCRLFSAVFVPFNAERRCTCPQTSGVKHDYNAQYGNKVVVFGGGGIKLRTVGVL